MKENKDQPVKKDYFAEFRQNFNNITDNQTKITTNGKKRKKQIIESSSDDDSIASFKENISSNIKIQNNKRKFNDLKEIKQSPIKK